ncbi:MAG: spore coat protein [Clostridia bacterium]|nr:spore coat protein [Clostridia bacterium]
MVNMTPKEMNLVNDLKKQEKLCIEKYRQYASRACDNRLKCLFQELEQHETHHLQMLEEMGKGQIPQTTQNQQSNQQGNQANASRCAHENTCSQQDFETDKFLCQDALSMEKYVSSAYDTGIFEFSETGMRDALNWIQKQEQQHGEKIWQYMNENNMYN